MGKWELLHDLDARERVPPWLIRFVDTEFDRVGL